MSTYCKNPALVERQLRDTCLLVPVMSSFEELDSLYSLNETARFIWQKACQGLDDQSIVLELADTFNVPAEKSEADATATLSELCTLKLLTRNP